MHPPWIRDIENISPLFAAGLLETRSLALIRQKWTEAASYVMPWSPVKAVALRSLSASLPALQRLLLLLRSLHPFSPPRGVRPLLSGAPMRYAASVAPCVVSRCLLCVFLDQHT